MKGKPHGKGKLKIKGKTYDCEFKYGKLKYLYNGLSY